jgi:hypothetical protein
MLGAFQLCFSLFDFPLEVRAWIALLREVAKMCQRFLILWSVLTVVAGVSARISRKLRSFVTYMLRISPGQGFGHHICSHEHENAITSSVVAYIAQAHQKT